jgi:DNA-directed RNA polymerase subunit RPC12/RpoP
VEAESDHSGWKVDYACPQCGAPAVLEETDRLFQCPFCRVRLFLAAKDLFRYCLVPGEARTGDLFYVPYWRFKGVNVSCQGVEIRHRSIDTTLIALDSPGFPVSLGLKPRSIPLRFAAPDMAGSLLKRTRSIDDALRLITETLQSVFGPETEENVYHETFLGETVSLLYNPFYVLRGVLYDAITGETLGPYGEDLPDLSEREEAGDWGIGFLPALCPYCGWNLSGERDSVVLLCNNCSRAWQALEKGFSEVEFLVEDNPEEDEAMVPFWRISAHVEGITLKSFADLARFANLPKAVLKEWEMMELAFWFPAFKVRSELFLRIARLVTIAGGVRTVGSVQPDSRYHPPNLSLSEVSRSLKLLVASLGAAKKKFFPRLPGIVVKEIKPAVVFIPLRRQGPELVHRQGRFSLNSNALLYGRNL